MCGIVGVISKGGYGFTMSEKKAFEELLFFDMLRGDDATGIAVISKEGDVKVAKTAMNAYTMSFCPEYQSLIQYAYTEGKVAIGHNRKRTIGENKDENAHPFVVNNEFVFVHNGTLYSHKQLADTTVDSEALAIHIHKALGEGKEDALDAAMAKVFGAWACVFYDMRTSTLYLMRNKERPLWLCELKNNEGYIFTSEYGIGVAAAARNGMPFERAFMLEPDHVYSFDLSQPNLTYVGKPHCRKLAEKHTFFPPASPPPAIPVSGKKCGGGAVSKVYALGGELSKSQFKRLQKRYLGRLVQFIVEDYMERSVDDDGVKTPDQPLDWILMGVLEQNVHEPLSYFPNTVRGVVSDKKLEEILEVYNGVMVGKVINMEYENSSKQAVIQVVNPHLPESVAKEHAPTPNIH